METDNAYSTPTSHATNNECEGENDGDCEKCKPFPTIKYAIS